MKHKSETLDKLKEFVVVTRNKFQQRSGVIQADNGGEYLDKQKKAYLKQQEIECRTVVPYTPEQNGVTERQNRSLLQMPKGLLLYADLSNKFCGQLQLF